MNIIKTKIKGKASFMSLIETILEEDKADMTSDADLQLP